MFLGPRITLGAFVPDDYGAMYCWANDIAAARLDGAFRPANLREVIASCETGADASRVMLAIRQRIDPKIIGYINIHNVNAVHRSADLGMRIGDERHRGQGFGKEALAMALKLEPSQSRARRPCRIPPQCAGDCALLGLRFQEGRHSQALPVCGWSLGRLGPDGGVPAGAQTCARHQPQAA
jgi:Acetyltransferase (GNAT) domain